MVGYRVIGFIHDEVQCYMWSCHLPREVTQVLSCVCDQILIELHEDSDWTAEAKMVERIVCESMQELNGTIPIGCSYSLSRFWSKEAAAVFDERGQLCVWEPECV